MVGDRAQLAQTMAQRQFIDVACACGAPLARYRKSGKGRLIKMFLHKIADDRAGVFLPEPPLQLHDDVHCPACGRRVATLRMILGRPAAKVNHGAVRVV
ncbi:MAG TPA: hypothetical protein QGG47_13525 [Acidobacteriota bacterium]|nr:hypothetical protein [Acidobacteriota bacterium]